jgi:hypothetical protein
MDIQALMMEVNAGLLERGTKPSPSKQILIDEDRGPELLTFRTNGGPHGKIKCRLSKRSTVLQDPLAQKYGLNEETHNLNSEVSLLSAVQSTAQQRM